MPTIQKQDFRFLFPTLVLTRVFEGTEELNARLRALILEQEQTTLGVRRSNVGGWHSDSDFMRWPAPEVEKLRDLLAGAIRDYVAMDQHLPPGEFRLRYQIDAWANIAWRGHYMRPHLHGNANYSGVYYVDAGATDPEHPESGRLEFTDPRGPITMFHTVVGEPLDNFVIQPRSGLLVIFPSWLRHFAHPYFGQTPRINVAFNVIVQAYERKPPAAPAEPA